MNNFFIFFPFWVQNYEIIINYQLSIINYLLTLQPKQ